MQIRANNKPAWIPPGTPHPKSRMRPAPLGEQSAIRKDPSDGKTCSSINRLADVLMDNGLIDNGLIDNVNLLVLFRLLYVRLLFLRWVLLR